MADAENLADAINVSQSQCLNSVDGSGVANLLPVASGICKSDEDVDEQLLFIIPFQQPVKLVAIEMAGPDGNAPLGIKIFLNKENLDFAEAEDSPATESFDLSKAQASGEERIGLNVPKYQNVRTIAIFVESNQGEEDVTIVERLIFYGTAIEQKGNPHPGGEGKELGYTN